MKSLVIIDIKSDSIFKKRGEKKQIKKTQQKRGLIYKLWGQTATFLTCAPSKLPLG